MAKSRDAFRTISEVSAALDTPTHVLRFWESKFSQIKPVKRAGGRRYYRPDDIALLSGIKTLLHEQGMTIKGAQKLLRENGVKHVMTLAKDGLLAEPEAPATAPVAAAPVTTTPAPAPTEPEPVEEKQTVQPAAPKMPPPTSLSPPKPDNVVSLTSAVDDQSDVAAAEVSPPEPTVTIAQPVAKVAEPRPTILAQLSGANADKLRSNRTKIAPLVARLEALRDQMRAQ